MTLREARLQADWTQLELEKETKISQCRLSLLEGGYREPKAEEIEILKKVLRVDKIDFNGA